MDQDASDRIKLLKKPRRSQSRTHVYDANKLTTTYALTLTRENLLRVRATMLEMADDTIRAQERLDNPATRVLIDGSPLKPSAEIKESVDVFFGEKNLDARPAMNAVQDIATRFAARANVPVKWVWEEGSGNGAPVAATGPVYFEQGGLLKLVPYGKNRNLLSYQNIANALMKKDGGVFLRRITQTSNRAIGPLFRVRMFFVDGGKPDVWQPSSGRFNNLRGGKPPRGGNVIQGVPIFYLRLGIGRRISPRRI